MSAGATCIGVMLLAPLVSQHAFSPATPESQGVPAARLEELGAVVQGYVDSEKVVGAELLVLRSDRILLHRGYGWRHREESAPMEPGGVFCLRSMTKPVVGAAVQMLIDAKLLEASATVARYLPSFEGERSRAITVEQLLTHTSGLRLSSLVGEDLARIGGERDIAARTGAAGPEFPPGTRFQYSDDGADVLGALVEVVGKKSLEDTLREKVFEPLGMNETTGVMHIDHPLRSRVCSQYAGGTGAWKRVWSPEDPPHFSFLLGSQGLYGTALDYARFLRLWKEKGRVNGEPLISDEAVRRALEPVHTMPGLSAFEGLTARYGQMMQLWVGPPEGGVPTLHAFGHAGSDGTIGWMFPELDLTVLYFTQSRNGGTVSEFGAAVQRCLLEPLMGTERSAALTYSREALAAFVGIYWDVDDEKYQAVLRRDDKLYVEFPGKAIMELAPTRRRDVFQFAVSPEYRLEFERDDRTTIAAFTVVRREKSERMPRIESTADLPDVDAVLDRKRKASDWSRIESLGALRIHSKIEMPALKLAGASLTFVNGLAQRRSDAEFGSYRERVLVNEGRAWSWNLGGSLEELAGASRAQAELDHPLLPAADWRGIYSELTLIAGVQHEGAPALLLRAVPRDGHAHTWILSAESGLPLALLAMEEVPGMGWVGTTTRFADWRDVSGLQLPFVRSTRFSSASLGSAEVRWETVESGVEFSASLLDPSTLTRDER